MIPPGKYYIDRIEGGIAVIIYSDGNFSLPAGLLPAGAGEGDFLRLELTVDRESREAAGEEVSRLKDRISGGRAGEVDDESG